MTCLTTNNQDWGFYGTLGARAEEAWPKVMKQLFKLVDNQEACRDFLDSRHGRHFADSVVEGLECDGLSLGKAIKQAINQWQAWTISKRTSFDTGIPEGLPYLSGFIMSFEVDLDLAS